MFTRQLWQEIGRALDRVDRAGARGNNVLDRPGCEEMVEMLLESRLTRYLAFVCVEPPMRRFLRPALAHRLAEREQTRWVAHLKVCDRCREELKATKIASMLWQRLGLDKRQ